MIKPEQIPVEAFKAGIDAWNSNLGKSYTASVREIISAAINAWPGAVLKIGLSCPENFIDLPVPKESTND